MDILPPELWRDIVEISAYSSFHQAARLTEVSQVFHEFARPILFRVYFGFQYKSLPANDDDVRWFEEKGKYVRHLLWRRPTKRLPHLLTLCPNIENLALWVNSGANNVPALLPALSNLRPQRLSINIRALYANSPFTIAHAQEPWLQNVTHLDMLHPCYEWELNEGLAELPRLTHIAFSDQVRSVVIENLLKRCKGLRIIVVLDSHEANDDNGMKGFVQEQELGDSMVFDDPRVVGLGCEYEGDWELGAEGKDDMWVEAERIVEKRRAAKSR